jgi:hypothetical protein
MIYVFVIHVADDEHRVIKIEAENEAAAECQCRSVLYEETGRWFPLGDETRVGGDL